MQTLWEIGEELLVMLMSLQTTILQILQMQQQLHRLSIVPPPPPPLASYLPVLNARLSPPCLYHLCRAL